MHELLMNSQHILSNHDLEINHNPYKTLYDTIKVYINKILLQTQI